MTATLIIGGERHPIRPERDHPASHYDIPVLLVDGDWLLDGWTFREQRDTWGDWLIETDDPDGVCLSLGVPAGEPGVVKVAG